MLAHNRSISYGFAVFHRLPVLLSPLNSPKSGDSSKVTDQVKFVRPRRHAETSPAKALDLAAEQFENNGKSGARSIVVLVHNGDNSDLIAETLEAVDRLRKQKVQIFAISGSEDPNILALSGYTRQRERIYSNDTDRVTFLSALDTVIGFCVDSEKKILEKVVESIEDIPERKKTLEFNASLECPKNQQIDLVLVLDTSGSVFRAFAEERELASNLIRQIDPEKFEENIQIGLVSFASEPLVLLPLNRGRTPNTVINRINNIDFTGMNTRISDAVELALSELESRRRTNALQVIVLITDGHGQEFWNQAQSAGRKLQKSESEVFVSTTLEDFNLQEILLYAGDESRVFVGKRSSEFLSTVGRFINRCVGNENYTAPASPPKHLNGDSIIKLNSQRGQIVGQSIITNDKIQEVPLEATGNDKVSPDDVIRPADDSAEDSEEDDPRGSPEEDSSEREIWSIKEKEEAREKADQLRKFLSEQKGLPKSADCDTDLVFVIERSQRSTFNFSDQLDLTAKVVEGIVPEDVKSGKVRLGLITFSKKSRTIVPLDSEVTSEDFVEKIRSVLPFHSASNLEKGLDTVVEEINQKRRKEARVVVVLVTSGKVTDENSKAFERASAGLKKVSNSDVFAISLNPFNDVNNLKVNYTLLAIVF